MFRLARDLGMSVKELGRKMDMREFRGWMAFYAWEADQAKRGEHESRAARMAAIASGKK